MKRPLPASFTILGLLGTIIFTIYTYSGRINRTWGLAFLLLCVIIFVSSLTSLGQRKSKKDKKKK